MTRTDGEHDPSPEAKEDRLETRALTPALALILSGFALAGCTELAAGGAGSALEEDDGRFDPGENTELGGEIHD